MSKTYCLSFSIDNDGKNSFDLVTSNSLYKLDQFMQKFVDDKDVRRYYDEEIGEFCLYNMKIIQEENERNHRNRTGGIYIFERSYNDEGKLYMSRSIKVIYKDYCLPPRRSCLYKIQRALEEDGDKLEQLLKVKWFVLENDEKNLLKRFLDEGDEHYYDEFISRFISRIRDAKSWYAYWVCRMLASMCNLVVKKYEPRRDEEDYDIRLDEMAQINDDIDKMMGKTYGGKGK